MPGAHLPSFSVRDVNNNNIRSNSYRSDNLIIAIDQGTQDLNESIISDIKEFENLYSVSLNKLYVSTEIRPHPEDWICISDYRLLDCLNNTFNNPTLLVFNKGSLAFHASVRYNKSLFLFELYKLNNDVATPLDLAYSMDIMDYIDENRLLEHSLILTRELVNEGYKNILILILNSLGPPGRGTHLRNSFEILNYVENLTNRNNKLLVIIYTPNLSSDVDIKAVRSNLNLSAHMLIPDDQLKKEFLVINR